MTKLKVYTLDESEQWDKIVRSFKEYDVYWLSGYVKAFQIHGDGEPLLFFYEDQTAKGINVVMKRDVSKDERFKDLIKEEIYFDFATPYGYGGWIIEGNGTEGLFRAYHSWIEEHGIISEFVRFHPLVMNHEACVGFYDVIRLGAVVHMDLLSPEMIWRNMSGKSRNKVRKAEKNGIKIYNGRYPKIYRQFHMIYDETMDKDEAKDYYYFEDSFYKSILEDLPQNAQIFFAEKDGEVISASIVLTANKRMNYHLSGSLKEYSSLASGNLLLYEAALWGCENGYRTFCLGGGIGSEDDSLFKYKRAFYKGELNHFYIGKKIFDHRKYNELVEMRGVLESEFFPRYRA